jgi:hypothetical protein
MNSILTPAQTKILQAVVGIYSEKSEAVKSEEIARLINSTPSTVRSQMQVLTSLGLVEGVPGPKGGYRPTYKAYEVLFSGTLKKALKVFIRGRKGNVKIERVILTALSDPKKREAVIKLRQKANLSKGDRIRIVYAEQLVIDGTVSGLSEDEIIIDIEQVIAYPKEAVGSVASPFVLIDSKLTIKDAASILLKQGVYSGVVVEEYNATGILTLEHIARAVADGRTECKVSEVCADLVIVDSRRPIGEAIQLLDKNSRVLIVVENGRFKGIVSENDLLVSVLQWLS